MISLVLILISHFYSDYVAQGSFVSQKKCNTRFYMFYHCLLYSLIVGATMYLTMHVSLWSIPILFVTHWFIDDVAACRAKLNDWQDLLAHLIVIEVLILLGGLCI